MLLAGISASAAVPQHRTSPHIRAQTSVAAPPDASDVCRCSWATSSKNAVILQKYIDYHDKEWGVPVFDDDRLLFEMLVLEGAQAGLSWATILNKRHSYREAFDNFEAKKVSEYDQDKVVLLPPPWCIISIILSVFTSLLAMARRCRNYSATLALCATSSRWLQPSATPPVCVGAARPYSMCSCLTSTATGVLPAEVLEVQEEHGSFGNYLWSFMPGTRCAVYHNTTRGSWLQRVFVALQVANPWSTASTT